MARKESVTVKRKDILTEMSIKLGIYEDFDINEFLSIVADTILDTDNPKSPYRGYEFNVVDDDYEFTKLDLQFKLELFETP